MAAYDNLLANVPTDLWIGGKWKKSSDGARFDVIDPATERKIASVASASIDDAKAALDAAQGAFPAWAAKKPRERGEILRKAYELIMRDAERLAKLITIENGKALVGLARRGGLRRRVLPLVRRGGRAQSRHERHGAGLGRAHVRASQAGRRRRAGDAVEFPGGDGDPQDRSGARRRLPGGAQARLRDAADHAGADADPGRGRRAGRRRQRHPVAPLRARWSTPCCTIRASASCRSPARPKSAASSCTAPPTRCSTPRWSWAATRRSSCSRTPTSMPRSTAR